MMFNSIDLAFWNDAFLRMPPHSVCQIVVLANLIQDLRKFPFGREILDNNLRKALILAFSALQPVISLFCYGYCPGWHGVNICLGACTYKSLYKIASAEFHQAIEGLIIAASNSSRLWGLVLGIRFCFCWSYHPSSIFLTREEAAEEDLAQSAELLTTS